jgi:hypothetical protein
MFVKGLIPFHSRPPESEKAKYQSDVVYYKMTSVDDNRFSNSLNKSVSTSKIVVSTKLLKEEVELARKLAWKYYEQHSISSPNLSQLLRLLVRGNIGKYREDLNSSSTRQTIPAESRPTFLRGLHDAETYPY